MVAVIIVMSYGLMVFAYLFYMGFPCWDNFGLTLSGHFLEFLLAFQEAADTISLVYVSGDI